MPSFVVYSACGRHIGEAARVCSLALARIQKWSVAWKCLPLGKLRLSGSFALPSAAGLFLKTRQKHSELSGAASRRRRLLEGYVGALLWR